MLQKITGRDATQKKSSGPARFAAGFLADYESELY